MELLQQTVFAVQVLVLEVFPSVQTRPNHAASDLFA